MGWPIKAAMALVTAILFSLSVFAQQGALRHKSIVDDELLYLPNEKLLTHFTGGMSSIIANMLWLRCVRYIAEEAKGARNFEWLEEMLHTVVRLDPYFVDAYRFGGLFLAALKAEDDAGLALLHKGIKQNPNAWELPYECAMIYLLNRRDHPHASIRAAHYLAMSAATGEAPPFVADVASKLQSEHNLVEIEFEMWARMAQSNDAFLRELAETKLQELQQRLQQRQNAPARQSPAP